MSLIKYGTTIPVFVKRLREEMKCSQRQFGDLLGYHGQYVSNVERGEHECPEAFVAAVMGLVSGERAKYLHDLLIDASAQKTHKRLQSKKRKLRA